MGKVIAILFFIVLLVALGVGLYVFNFAIRRHPEKPATPPKEDELPCRKYYFQHQSSQLQWLEDWGYEKVFLVNQRGARLAGYYFKSPKKTKRTVLAVHGYRSTGFSEYLFMAPMYLEDLEMNLLIVDDYAHGQSAGQNIGFGYFDRLDVHGWCHWLEERDPEVEILLQGISMGCATVIMAAGDKNAPKSIKGVMADCGYASLRGEMHDIITRSMKLPFTPIYQLGSLVCKIAAGYFFDDATPQRYIADVKVPVVFIHGTVDRFVLPENSQIMYDTCTSWKKLVWVKDAPHAHSFLTNKTLYKESLTALITAIAWND